MGFVTDIQFVDTLAHFYAHTPYIPIVLDNGATCHRATRFSGLYVTLPPTRDLMGTWRIRVLVLIARNEIIENIGQSQSRTISKLRM